MSKKKKELQEKKTKTISIMSKLMKNMAFSKQSGGGFTMYVMDYEIG